MKWEGKVRKDGRLCDLKFVGNIWKSNTFIQCMLTRYEKFEDIWTIDLGNLVRTQRLYVVRGGAPDNFRGVVCGCPLFSGKNVYT